MLEFAGLKKNCCLLTPGLCKDILCHVWSCSFVCLQNTRADIRPQVKWAVSLMIAYGPLYSSSGVCVGYVQANAHEMKCSISHCSILCFAWVKCLSSSDAPWPSATTRLTAHFICGLMSDLVICKFRKSMVVHDTECPYWDQVSLNNTIQPTNSDVPAKWLSHFMARMHKKKSWFIKKTILYYKPSQMNAESRAKINT